MEIPRIEIKTKGEGPSAFTEIYINGHRIPGVRSYELKHFAGERPILTLDINALDISIDEPMLLYQRSMEGRPIKNIKIEFEEEIIDDNDIEKQ